MRQTARPVCRFPALATRKSDESRRHDVAEGFTMRLETRTLICLGVSLLLVGLSPNAIGQRKPILVAVKVEAEGGGEDQGMWVQAAEDLTPRELKTLESLVVTETKKQEGVKIVPLDYSEDYIGVVVVAAKLPNGNTGQWYYVASSVVTIATKKGIDELVTHDVLAGADLASLARTIGFRFASVRLRAALGLWK
jgi:hypothetical protein